MTQWKRSRQADWLRGEFIVQNGAPVDYAREHITAKVIESGLDAVIWIDTDLIIPPDALVRLVKCRTLVCPSRRASIAGP